MNVHYWQNRARRLTEEQDEFNEIEDAFEDRDAYAFAMPCEGKWRLVTNAVYPNSKMGSTLQKLVEAEDNNWVFIQMRIVRGPRMVLPSVGELVSGAKVSETTLRHLQLEFQNIKEPKAKRVSDLGSGIVKHQRTRKEVDEWPIVHAACGTRWVIQMEDAQRVRAVELLQAFNGKQVTEWIKQPRWRARNPISNKVVQLEGTFENPVSIDKFVREVLANDPNPSAETISDWLDANKASWG